MFCDYPFCGNLSYIQLEREKHLPAFEPLYVRELCKEHAHKAGNAKVRKYLRNFDK